MQKLLRFLIATFVLGFGVISTLQFVSIPGVPFRTEIDLGFWWPFLHFCALALSVWQLGGLLLTLAVTLHGAVLLFQIWLLSPFLIPAPRLPPTHPTIRVLALHLEEPILFERAVAASTPGLVMVWSCQGRTPPELPGLKLVPQSCQGPSSVGLFILTDADWSDPRTSVGDELEQFEPFIEGIVDGAGLSPIRVSVWGTPEDASYESDIRRRRISVPLRTSPVPVIVGSALHSSPLSRYYRRYEESVSGWNVFWGNGLPRTWDLARWYRRETEDHLFLAGDGARVVSARGLPEFGVRRAPLFAELELGVQGPLA